MKNIIQSLIRLAHVGLFQRNLPDRLGVYFHQLDDEDLAGFEAALSTLSGLGYRFVSPLDFLKAEGKVVYLSFDDNHREWFLNQSLFQKYGATATFYINTCVLRGETGPDELGRFHKAIAYTGASQPLSREEIAILSAAGHTIGAHTHSHPAMCDLSVAEAETEMMTNRGILEDIIQKPVTNMAFTYGMPRHFPAEMEKVCRRLGFETIAWATPGLQFQQGVGNRLQRTQWRTRSSAASNLQDLRIDGRLFVKLTGRSPIA